MAKAIGKLASEINVIRTGLENGIYNNEAEVRQGIVDTLLQCLGWRTNDTTVVRPEYTIADGRVDYALCHPPQTPMVLIEVKRVGNITGAEEQLFWYAFRQGVPILILTDGRLWRFFYPSGIGTYNDRLVCELDLSDTDSDKNASKLQRYLSSAAIRNGMAVDDITDDYRELASQRTASASLPETWRKLVDGVDERLIDVLAEATKDDCGHKPSREHVLDFLKTLRDGMEHHNDVPPPTPDPRPRRKSDRYPPYFQALIDELREQHNFTKARVPGKGSNSNYYNFASGFSPIGYVAGFNNARTVYTQLWLNFGDYETTKNFFDVLKERESEINAKFDVSLYWNRRDDITTSRIYIERDGDIESSERELEALRAWHVENLLKFKEVFTPEIQRALEKIQSRKLGGSDDESHEYVLPNANFVSATPPEGEIAANGSITVTFDNAPADVTVSAGTVTVAGKTATIAGPFTPGPLALTITWADGTQALNYTVTPPGTTMPTVTGGTVSDGDKDVDPEAINTAAAIEIKFSEEVSGNVALQTEGGADVGWLGKVEGNKATLELVKGKEIGNETTYVIKGKVSDAAGNTANIFITFVTAIKE